MKWRFWEAMLALLVAGCATCGAAAGAQLPPAAGRFLVASPQQQGFFAKSVILLIEYGPDGAFGIVVNHPTKLALSKVLTDPGMLSDSADLLYIGGPVSLDSLTMLIRSSSAPPESVRVLEGVYASSSMAALRAAVGRKLTSKLFRAYAGYAGWEPGQLDSELQLGAWIVVPAHADNVFAAAPGNLWDKLCEQSHTLLVQLVPPEIRFPSRPHGQVELHPAKPGTSL